MTVSVTTTDARVCEMKLRMPFQFGNVTATERPLLFLGATVDIDGTTRHGVASDTMLPRWFLKAASYPDALDAMVAVVEQAREHVVALDPADSVFDAWWSLYRRQRAWGRTTQYPALLWNFGVSLVERALIDAACRHYGMTFAEAVRENQLGIELGRIYDRLAGQTPAALLPAESRRSLAVRHTVGHTDPLTDADLPAADRLNDGLPQTLQEYIRTDGVSHFKIKLVGDVSADIDRIREIAAVLEATCDSGYVHTFDANEQYPDIDDVRRLYERLRTEEATAAFADRLLAIEQPVPRESAFSADAHRALESWSNGPPVIIDESDGAVNSLARALECGYAGTSHKNCKGVFKGIANACLVEAHDRMADDEQYLLTAEDLTNVGPVALLQDLAVVATLGMDHVERNGHHYVRGLEFLPAELQATVGRAHGDLYGERDGYHAVDIANGSVDIGSVVDAPFGVGFELDETRFSPLTTWQETQAAADPDG